MADAVTTTGNKISKRFGVALAVAILCVGLLAVWRIDTAALSQIDLPPGLTMMFEATNVPIRVYVQCDTARHNLVYASGSAIVVIEKGC